ncbi:Pycsar system effector family protein [Mailhella sp.]
MKELNNHTQDSHLIDYKIKIATETLDRNIGFIVSCDNKTSIILTGVGVFLTILFSSEGIKNLFCIINYCIDKHTSMHTIYLLSMACSFLFTVVGVFKLASVLIAYTSEGVHKNEKNASRIFFAGILTNESVQSYNKKFCMMTKEELLNDLIMQIYINASIAANKYKKYYLGIRCTIIGFMFIISNFLFGFFIF